MPLEPGACCGNDRTVPGLVLLYYLTNVLAVPAALAALVILAPTIWDVLGDPFAVALSDRTRSRWGQRRPWLLVGVLTLPVSFAAIFAAPPLSGVWAAGCVSVLFLVTSTAFSIFQVPYVAMPAEMSVGHDERSLLMAWRTAFLGVAILLSGALAPAIAQSQGGSAHGYRVMAAAVGGFLLFGTPAAFFGTRRAPRTVPVPTESALSAQRAAARKRPCQGVVQGVSPSGDTGRGHAGRCAVLRDLHTRLSHRRDSALRLSGEPVGADHADVAAYRPPR
nr:MFS transporter [Nocardiopsis ansamitocini]